MEERRTLEDLHERALPALRHSELVKVAKDLKPTAAYDKAMAMCYGEDLARSCRFLAILVRDYGTEALQQFVQLSEEEKLDRRLLEEISTGIGFLERIGGGGLIVAGLEHDGVPLIDHLATSKACTVDLELGLGAYRIKLKYQPDGERMRLELIVTGPDGEKLETVSFNDEPPKTEQSFWLSRMDSEPPSRTMLRARLYNELAACFYQGDISVQPVTLLIINDMEKRGHKVAPRLWKHCQDSGTELWKYREYGLVHQLRQVTESLRQRMVSEGISKQAMAYLDLEIHEATKEAIENDKIYDEGIPLLDKLRDKTLTAWVDWKVVPGPVAAKTYNFLYHSEAGGFDLVKGLQRQGYGGSVVISFFNLPAGLRIARTGQCSAFIQNWHDHRDYGSKETLLADAQESMEAAQRARGRAEIPVVPKEINYGGSLSMTLMRQLPLQ